jgi:hypothetical protein
MLTIVKKTQQINNECTNSNKNKVMNQQIEKNKMQQPITTEAMQQTNNLISIIINQQHNKLVTTRTM